MTNKKEWEWQKEGEKVLKELERNNHTDEIKMMKWGKIEEEVLEHLEKNGYTDEVKVMKTLQTKAHKTQQTITSTINGVKKVAIWIALILGCLIFYYILFNLILS